MVYFPAGQQLLIYLRDVASVLNIKGKKSPH